MIGDETFDVETYAFEGGQNAKENNYCSWTRSEAWECFLEAHDGEMLRFLDSRMARNAFRAGWDGE